MVCLELHISAENDGDASTRSGPVWLIYATMNCAIIGLLMMVCRLFGAKPVMKPWFIVN